MCKVSKETSSVRVLGKQVLYADTQKITAVCVKKKNAVFASINAAVFTLPTKPEFSADWYRSGHVMLCLSVV